MRISLPTLAVALLICPACGSDSPERIVGGRGSFESASLSIGAGMADAAACASDHLNTFTITSQPAVAGWNTCLGLHSGTSLGQGSRPISDTELASVADALRQVRVGQSGICKKDGAFITLDIQANGTTGRYIDLPSACGATGSGPEGRTYVTGLQSVEYAMWRLSQ